MVLAPRPQAAPDAARTGLAIGPASGAPAKRARVATRGPPPRDGTGFGHASGANYPPYASGACPHVYSALPDVADAQGFGVPFAPPKSYGAFHAQPEFRFPHAQQSLGHLPVPDRRRRALPGQAGPLGGNAAPPQARADRGHPHRTRQRHHRPLRGLPRPALADPRSRQGRRALPPGRHAGRSDGAVGLDDGQERRGEPALRRRQGRHPPGPQDAVAEGTGKGHPPLHQRDRHHHRPDPGHPRA